MCSLSHAVASGTKIASAGGVMSSGFLVFALKDETWRAVMDEFEVDLIRAMVQRQRLG